MGYEVTTFKVTWGLPPKARLRLKSNGNSDIQSGVEDLVFETVAPAAARMTATWAVQIASSA